MTERRPRDLPGLRAKFEDFDKQDVYERVVRRACDPAAQNFVVLFGPDKAKVALDLDTDDFEDLFILKDARCPVRWINFWNTSDHDDAIKIIGDHYGFTRRLRASIVNWDEYRRHNKGHKATVDQKRVREEQLRAQQQPDNTHAEKTDLETGLNGDAIKQAHARAEDVGKNAGPATLDPKVMADFKVVQDALNYTTTDYGARCKSLSRVSTDKSTDSLCPQSSASAQTGSTCDHPREMCRMPDSCLPTTGHGTLSALMRRRRTL